MRYDLSDTQPSTAVLMAILRRGTTGIWGVRAIGEFHETRFVKKLVDPRAAPPKRDPRPPGQCGGVGP